MPKIGGKIHNCKDCPEHSTKERSNKGGICTKHQMMCPIHDTTYHYIGEECGDCKAARAIAASKERKAKEKAEKAKKKEEEGKWYKDDSKERKKDRKGGGGGTAGHGIAAK